MGPDGQGGCVSSYCAPKYVLQHARVLTYVKGVSSCTTGGNALTRSHDASIHHPQVWICHLRSSDPRSTGLDLQITGCEHSAHRMCRWSTHTYMHSYVRLHTRTCTATYACTHVHAHVRCQVQHVQLPDALMQSTAPNDPLHPVTASRGMSELGAVFGMCTGVLACHELVLGYRMPA